MIKKILMTTVLAVASWLMVGLALFVGLGVYGEVADVQEDDQTFNCHMMGVNPGCGPGAPWHGFVNLNR